MVREVIIYPNPILKRKSEDVKEFDAILHKLLDDMYETMIKKEGIGLAAIQIAEPLNIFIINLAREDNKQYREDLIEFINPKILKTEGETIYQEGCLSVPGFYEDVKRFDTIEVEYFDRNGRKITEKFDGLKSIAFQHEYDHLQGKLFVERLSFLKRKKFDKEWKKMQKKKKF